MSVLKVKLAQMSGLVEKKDRELKVLKEALRCAEGSARPAECQEPFVGRGLRKYWSH
jgi:hypothetical protein